MADTSPFSFHCMICFEEFDHDARSPVVLPCGHTYVCAECASRIDRCIECRTSVYAPLPPIESKKVNGPETVSRYQTATRGRTSHVVTTRGLGSEYNRQFEPEPQINKKKKVKRTRLPLPKNVVLLSLMEASELKGDSSADPNSVCMKDDSSSSAESIESAQEIEDAKIRTSTNLVVGACGTYAVANRGGLIIIERNPHAKLRKRIGDSKKTSEQWEKDAEDIILKSSNSRQNLRSKSRDASERLTLNYGDRVQVVTIVDGWAKLARGYGYIQCKNGSDLVKVGNPLDKACSIEALILKHVNDRNELREAQTAIERKGHILTKELATTMLCEEDLTVVDASIISPVFTPEKTRESRDDEDHLQLLQSSTKSSVENDGDLRKPNREQRTDLEQSTLSSLFGFLSRVVDSTCEHRQNLSQSTNIFRSASSVGESDMVTGAQEWRRRNGREAVSEVDFRTGMSGHFGAAQQRARPQYTFVNSRQQDSHKMSCHSGLNISRRDSTISTSSIW